jgi:glycosyltransferase involved in cell wall biosynthesis
MYTELIKPIKSSPRVEICLPVYNGANFIDQAFQSIASQSTRDFNVLVSDNASSDETPHIIRKWSKSLDVRYIRQDSTLDSVDHFNFVLGQVTAEYYMILCHDDYLNRPSAIEVAIQMLDGNPDISAVYCDLTYTNASRRTLLRKRFRPPGTYDAALIGAQSVMSARNAFGVPLLIRRSCLGSHRYDRQFKYCADLDLTWRISKGSPIGHISDFCIAYRLHDANASWNLLPGAHDDFVKLGEKHGMQLTPGQWRQVRLSTQVTTLMRQTFGMYSNTLSKLLK